MLKVDDWETETHQLNSFKRKKYGYLLSLVFPNEL